MQLYDGRIIRWGKAANRWQTLEFKTYQLPLQVFSFALKGGVSESEMSLRELRVTIAQQPRGSDLSNRALVEMNQRFAMPVGAVLLCLMALTLGSQRGHGRTWGLVLGLVDNFGVLYNSDYWRLAVEARMDPGVAPWLSNFLSICVAVFYAAIQTGVDQATRFGDAATSCHPGMMKITRGRRTYGATTP